MLDIEYGSAKDERPPATGILLPVAGYSQRGRPATHGDRLQGLGPRARVQVQGGKAADADTGHSGRTGGINNDAMAPHSSATEAFIHGAIQITLSCAVSLLLDVEDTPESCRSAYEGSVRRSDRLPSQVPSSPLVDF